MVSALLSGYIGFGNLGDELTLKNVVKLLREMGLSNIYAVSGDLEYSQEKHPIVNFIDRNDYKKITEVIKSVDFVALCGGTLFQEYNGLLPYNLFENPKWGVNSYINVPILAKIYNKPLMYLFQGVGPLFSEDAYGFTRFAYSLSDYTSVRDLSSRSLLSSMGFDEIDLAYDPVFLYPIEKQSRTSLDKKIYRVGISLRQWLNDTIETNITNAMADFLNRYSGDSQYSFFFISFQDFDDPNSDTKVFEKLSPKLKNKDQLSLVSSKKYTLEEIESFIADLDFMISMRLHGVILSIKYNIPFVAISYWNKVENVIKDLDISCPFINLDEITGDELYKNFSMLISGYNDYTVNMTRANCLLAERIRCNNEVLRTYIQEGLQHKPYSITTETKKLNMPVCPQEWLEYLSFQEYFKSNFYSYNHSRLTIERILKRSAYKKIVIFPSHLSWDIPLRQRPHHIMTKLSERGYMVFFINLYPQKISENTVPIREINENLYVVSDASVLYSLKETEVILWIIWTPFSVFTTLFPKSIVIYDWVDDLRVFYLYSMLMEIDHKRMLDYSDIVFTTSESLLKEAQKIRQDSLLVPNGVNVSDFVVDDEVVMYDDMANIIGLKKPIIGFYGSIEQWRMDYDLINFISQKCPDLVFVFIGPSYDKSADKIRPSNNIFLLGPKSYDELKHYLFYFDVAIIPYKVNSVTNAVFPVKLCEFMAAGKPVVSTNIDECKKFKSVLISDNYTDFVANIRKALVLKSDKNYIELLMQEASENTWDKRVDVILHSLNKTLSSERTDKTMQTSDPVIMEENNAFKRMLWALIGHNRELNERLSEESSAKVTIWKSYNYVKTDAERIGEQLIKLKTEVDSLKSELDSSNAKVDSLKSELDSSNAKVDSLKSELDLTKTERDSFRSEKDSLAKECEDLKTQLWFIHNSKIWKILKCLTRPIDKFYQLKDGTYKRANQFYSLLKLARHEGIKTVIASVKNKIKGTSLSNTKNHSDYEPDFNPYKSLNILKPIDVLVIDKEYKPIEYPKFSVVMPVKNEENTIYGLLKTLYNQTIVANELVLINNSEDNTDKEIERFRIDYGDRFNIQVLNLKDKTLSYYRNQGLKKAENEIVIFIDAGIMFENSLLANLIGAYMEFQDADLIGSIYYSDNYWAKKFIWDWDSIDYSIYLPSCKSLLIKKSVALSINGFRESLPYTGEDTLFGIEYRKMSQRWVINKAAKVFWYGPTSKEAALKKAFVYGKGDGHIGFGAFKYYEQLVNFLKDRDIRSLSFADEIVQSNFMGFLEGRDESVNIHKEDFDKVFLILSGIPMTDSGGGQRGAQMAMELMKQGNRVIYVNYYKSFEEHRLIYLDVDITNLELYYFFDFNLKDFCDRYKEIFERLVVLLEFPMPDFIPIVETLKSLDNNIKIIYDCIDNWDSDLGWTWYDKEKERYIINKSDLLITSAKTLKERLHGFTQKDVHLITNGVNLRLFRKNHYPQPVDLPAGKDIVIYVGALWGKWFDWELVKKLAEAYPELNFVYIGNISSIDNNIIEGIKGYKNIFCLGLKSQHELPSYLSFARCCTIPFIYDDEIIKYTNPLKVYEYLAMGIPVVSTHMDEIEGMPGVYLAKSHEEFIESIKYAIKTDLEHDEINNLIYQHSWEQKIKYLLELINKSL